MNRRDFIGGVVVLAVNSGATEAQQAKKHVVGYLGALSASTQSKSTAAFLERLRALGRVEGQNIAIEYRWAEGSTERAGHLATELAQLKVDVVVTSGAGAVLATMRATSEIPIVFAIATDPVGSGLVASLARPGGNVTGLSYQGVDLSSKRLELLREAVPGIRRLAVIADVVSPGGALEMREVESLAKRLGMDCVALDVEQTEDIARAFQTIEARAAQALYVCAGPLINTNRVRIVTLALAARLPTVYGEREHVEAGGLLSYGPNLSDFWRRAAEHVDKILNGVKPTDIPIEQPTKFYLVCNSTTAKVLGITIPPTLLARADEVIE